MELSLRQKQWTGAIASIVTQVAFFVPLNHFTGDFVSALLIILVNISLALTFKGSNPYLTGARWATFLCLGLASYARHSYWYQDVLDSFIRLRDFNNPVPWNQVFCQGNLEEIVIVTTTSIGLVIFYQIVSRWNEWTEKWETLRRSFFSASLGLQAVIVTTLIYPTALTMASALFFASVISPVLRRQVRFNHVVFMMLVPLFSLGSPPVAMLYGLVAGYFFLYFVSYERGLSTPIASFSFFNGVVFITLVLSLVANDVLATFEPLFGGLFALSCFILTLGLSYAFLYRNDLVETVRDLQRKFTPQKINNHAWWSIRDFWVDREIHHRREKLYDRKKVKLDLGLIFFGPKEWINKEGEIVKVEYSRVNLTPSILVLAFYSIWFLVDAVIALTPSRSFTIIALIIGFITILLVPLILLKRQWGERDFYRPLSVATSAVSALIFAMFMTVTLFFGLTANNTLANAAQQNNQNSINQESSVIVPAECRCKNH